MPMLIVNKSIISTSNGRNRFSDEPPRGVRVVLAPHELDVLVRHYERAAVQAERTGAQRAADLCAWRAACLKRREVR